MRRVEMRCLACDRTDEVVNHNRDGKRAAIGYVCEGCGS